MKHWVETHNVVQRKHGGNMTTQETQQERLVQTPRGVQLNPEYLRRLAAEHHEALTILSENDGPVAEAKNDGPVAEAKNDASR